MNSILLKIKCSLIENLAVSFGFQCPALEFLQLPGMESDLNANYVYKASRHPLKGKFSYRWGRFPFQHEHHPEQNSGFVEEAACSAVGLKLFLFPVQPWPKAPSELPAPPSELFYLGLEFLVLNPEEQGEYVQNITKQMCSEKLKYSGLVLHCTVG